MSDELQGSLAVSLPGRLERAIGLLERIADQPSGAGLQTVSITDSEVDPGIQIGFPAVGSERLLLPRQPVGGEFTVTEAPQLILPANNRRLGVVVTNPSEQEIALVLDEASRGKNPGIGTIILGEKQSWNGLIGTILWCGNITARTVKPAVSGVIAVPEV
jgi:hypothetical protein